MDYSLLLGVRAVQGDPEPPREGRGAPASLLGLARPLSDWGGTTMFAQWNGGVLGLAADGSVPMTATVSHVAIIDILQVFNLRKKLEGSVKGLRFNKSKISSIEAGKYGERFLKFISERIG
jgi:hypothetical protein